VRRARMWTGIAAASLVLVGACSSSGDSTATTIDAPPCPTAAVDVVVTVDQWTDIVQTLAGSCADVTTIIKGADVDPHEFEPTPADNARFLGADLVVANGLGYDEWANKVLETLSPRPPLVDAGEVVGRTDGDNPHVWYDPTAVKEVAAAITAELSTLLPEAGTYLADRASAWSADLQPYLDEVAAVKAAASGRTYAATESVFDDMAAAVGLEDLTPDGYRAAAANETDPAPADVHAFEEALRGGHVDVLVVNTQTEGSLPAQLRSVAEGAGVPIVEITETMPPGEQSFVSWQVDQLRALGQALGG